ncbi:MAG TPA: hypothetical protein VNX60_10180 [Candidatus Acidoferrum sp.]|jgi:hypothetical protein|nr:hypothetical protein [Candidatus Acidoferrum sp.]
MNPLSTSGVGPVMRGLEKRADERDPVPRRKRPAARAKTAEDDAENNEEQGPDIPKHELDDLA